MKRVKILLVLLSIVAVVGVADITTTAYASSTSLQADFSLAQLFENVFGIDMSQTVTLGYLVPIAAVLIVLLVIMLIVSNSRLNRMKKSGGGYSAQIINSIPDAVIGTNKNAVAVFVNNATLDMFEMKESEILGKKVFSMLAFDSSSLGGQNQLKEAMMMEYPATVKKLLSTNNTIAGINLAYEVAKIKGGINIKNLTLGITNAANVDYKVNLDIRPINEENVDEGMIVTLHDVTQEVKAQERLEHLASHDSLTTLYNRDGLLNNMKKLDLANNQYGVINLNIDNIKETKDVYGNTVSDDCIKIFSTIIKEYSPSNSLVARTGDGEFMVVMPYTVESQIESAAAKFIRQAALIRGGIYNLTISAGIAYAPSHTSSVDEVIMYSEIANSSAKKAGKNQLVTFTQKLVDDIMEEHRWENDIEKAFYDNEFVMFYQPIVDLKAERIAKLEALARWQHPEKGILSPWYFINRIERMSIVHEFCYWVIEEVFKDYNEFIKTRYCVNNPISISINVSPQQLFDDEFTNVLRQLMERYNIPRGAINIEVTESFFEGDFARSLRVVQDIKDAGCMISMDDFGTEYSTLSKLHTINFDEVKLDKSFVDNIMTSEISLSITKMLVEISEKNDYELVAEGVETEEQLQLLASYGCNLFQGYYFYRPISKNDIMYIFNTTI